MSSTLLTAATDIFVIAGAAAAVATAALNSEIGPFRTTLGAEYEDDSLLAPETKHAISTARQQQSPLQKHVDYDSKAPTVTVNEVTVTPPAAELQKDDFFAGPKTA